MSVKLYELGKQYEMLIELPDKDEFVAAIASIEEEVNTKLINIAAWVKNVESEAEVFQNEADKLAQKAKSLKSSVEWVKEYAKSWMLNLGIDKVEEGVHSIWVQNNSVASVVVEVNTKDLPNKYLTAVINLPHEFVTPAMQQYVKDVTIDKRQIAKDINNGIKIEGATLDRGTHLRIK